MGKISWRREWLPTPVFLPGEFHGQKSLQGYSPWGYKELNMTERLTLYFLLGPVEVLANQGLWASCFQVTICKVGIGDGELGLNLLMCPTGFQKRGGQDLNVE